MSRPIAASPMVPVTITRSPGLAPVRGTICPAGTRPKAVIETVSGPGVDTVSPPSSGQPKPRASSPRPCALGGEIGQIDPQRLARDRVGRIIGQEMHALHNRIRGHDDVLAERFEN